MTDQVIIAAIMGAPATIAAVAAAILSLRNGWKADTTVAIAQAAVRHAQGASTNATKAVAQNEAILSQNIRSADTLAKVEKQTNGNLTDALRGIRETQERLDRALVQITDLAAARVLSEQAMKELKELAEKEARHARRNEEQIRAVQKMVEEHLASNPPKGE